VGGFPRADFQNLPFVILTLYHEKFKDWPVAFAPTRITYTLGQTISQAGLRQLHISESEKFAHVTFFLNGGNNQAFEGEVDIKLPSPRGVPFEQVPQLNLAQVVDQVESGIQQGFELIVTNFANGDVIGHTQNREAKIRCAEFVDLYLGKVVEVARAAGYVVLVTADHGNLEEMENPDGSPNVSHTANPVPLVLIPPQLKGDYTHAWQPGRYCPDDISSNGITQPTEMTGRSFSPGA
jgi:2,3-bisphosphoglycerate-independent phosphoglycerate mutase